MSVIQGPEFYISKRVGRAITDYDMLADRDKIASASIRRIIFFKKINSGGIISEEITYGALHE